MMDKNTGTKVLIFLFLIVAVACKVADSAPMECINESGSAIWAYCDNDGQQYVNATGSLITVGTVNVNASSTVYITDEDSGERAAVNSSNDLRVVTGAGATSTMVIEDNLTGEAVDIDTNGDMEVKVTSISAATGTKSFIADYQTPNIMADVLDGTIDAVYSAITDGTDLALIDGSGNFGVNINNATGMFIVDVVTAEPVDIDASGDMEVNVKTATNTFISDYENPAYRLQIDSSGHIVGIATVATVTTVSTVTSVTENASATVYITDATSGVRATVDASGHQEVSVEDGTIDTVTSVTTVVSVTDVVENSSATVYITDENTGERVDINNTGDMEIEIMGGTVDTVTAVTTVSTVTSVTENASSTVYITDATSGTRATVDGSGHQEVSVEDGTITTVSTVTSVTENASATVYITDATSGTRATVDITGHQEVSIEDGTLTTVATVTSVTDVASGSLGLIDDGTARNPVTLLGGIVDTVTSVTNVASSTVGLVDDGTARNPVTVMSGTVTPTRLSTYEYDNPTIGAGAEAAVNAAATSYVVSVYNGGADPIFVKLSGTAAADDGLEIPQGNGKTWENVSTSAISVYNSGAAGADIAVEWRR